MDKTPTIRDVAVAAGVSLGTVSNYLSGRKAIGPGTRERIDAAVSRLNYVPNAAVRVMRGQRHPAVALLVPDTANPFFAEVALGVEDAALATGHVVILCNTKGDVAREQKYIRTLAEMRVSGALITPVAATDSHFQKLTSSGGSVVLLDEPRRSMDLSALFVDDEHGGRIAAEHLVALGRRLIVFASGPEGDRQSSDRFRGARTAIAQASTATPALERLHGASSRPAGQAALAEEIASRRPLPDAILCANDMIALAVQTSLLRRGVRIPDDVAIVGYDDIEYAQLAQVPLTTVRQPTYELGRTATEILLHEVADPTRNRVQTSFVPALIVRESTIGSPSGIEGRSFL